MPDTRPIERIQHSYQHYGRMILKIYGQEAYQNWLAKKYQAYFGETRPHVCTKICELD